MQIEHSNEVDLIRQTLAGDTAAFDRLVKAHRTTVYMLVLSYTKNPADAEDLTQRIFIRAYKRLATLREWDRFLPWLQRITHNTCKDWIRRQGDTTISFEEMDDTDFTETAPSAEDIALKREIEAIVQEAISALTETDRKLVEGRYMEGASYDQLQMESGLSYAAIANRLKRAKQQLRRRIEKLLGGMAIVPGRTLIWGGIETVKLSVKTKLAAVGVVAVLGIGGGVWYHHTSESNPVIVNEQRGSGPETANEPTTDEIADAFGQSQRFERNEDSLRSKVGGNQKNSDVEGTTPDAVKPVVTPNEASDSVSEAEDEEFEAQWKQLKALVKERYGKDIEEIAEEYYADLRLRVDESVAQIESLFEDLASYKAQMEELKRQEKLTELAEDELEHQKKMAEWSVAWSNFGKVESKLYTSYIFLSHEAAASSFGHLYLSTPEYAKLKAWYEDWFPRQEKGFVKNVDGVWRRVEKVDGEWRIVE